MGLIPTLILASSSPRRRDLLARLGVEPARIASPDIDETPRKGEVPRLYALRMAEEKAVAVPRASEEIVVAGDTTVAVGRRILQQATDADMQRGFLTSCPQCGCSYRRRWPVAEQNLRQHCPL